MDNRSLCGDLKCVNTDGGYQCDCYPGFMKDDMGICTGETRIYILVSLDQVYREVISSKSGSNAYHVFDHCNVPTSL